MDEAVRLAAFQWLDEQVQRRGDVLPRELLHAGFLFEGQRVPLVGPQGIFKPRVMRDMPLTITTAPSRPYEDSFTADGLLLYRYREPDAHHRENEGLRRAMHMRAPLIYLHGVVKGKYLCTWPVLVVGEDPAGRCFHVAAEDPRALTLARESGETRDETAPEEGAARRSYITSQVRARVHQRTFRERVIQAYRRECALCRLRHEELLDAAHIIPDRDPRGEPCVTNGLALCKIHHASFDENLIGIRPDYKVEVRHEILEEKDGPMLCHGLQEMNDQRLHLPRRRSFWPDPERLARRYEEFRSAG